MSDAGTSAGRAAFIGVGVMGGTVLEGLLAAGWTPESLVIGVRRPERGEELTARTGVESLPTSEAAAAADMVVLAVKPADLLGVLDQIAPGLRPGTLVVSLAAGVPTSAMEEHLPDGTPVVRVMPNTPSQVAEGMAGVSGGSNADADHVARALEMMRAIGRAVEVPEKQQDALTAVSGSGPAYLFLVAEAMVDAGVLLGLPRATASELAAQTLFGAAKLLRESGDSATVLREKVTSPGGTTAAALRQLEAHGLRSAFADAMEACRDRSRELAEGA